MRLSNILLRAAILLTLAAGGLWSQTSVIVTVSSGSAQTVQANYRLNVVRSLDSTGNVQLVSFPDNDSKNSFLATAAVDSMIVSAEADCLKLVAESDPVFPGQLSPAATSLDPLVPGNPSPIVYFGNTVRQGYVQQPAALLIRVPDAQAAFGAGNATVADIDTGVDVNHPALRNIFVPGYDFITDQAGIPSDFSDLGQSTVALLDAVQAPAPLSSTTQPFTLSQSTVALLDQSTVALLDQSTVALLDSNPLPAAFGHGTMVSGLIHLVAPGAMIMPLRAFHSDGTGNLSDVVRAVYFAVDHGAQIINMSFSSTTDSPALNAALRYASTKDVICISSAGNQGADMKVYPAAYWSTIGVGSTDLENLRSLFSNFGDNASDTAAPGEALVTTYPGANYAGVWGTSFSAALVSGAAALAVGANPGLEPEIFRKALYSGYPLPNAGLGNARLDALALLQAIAGRPSESNSGCCSRE